MKLVLQRVQEAAVSVDGTTVGSIGHGLLVLLCIEKEDTPALAAHYASKTVELRIFNDEQGKMNRSLLDTGGELLLVSQFTLSADAEKGRRPSFDRAAPPDIAERLCSEFADHVKARGIRVATGLFRAMMKVSLVNDGPVTILLGKG